MKKCKICLEIKEIIEYGKHKSTKDGLRNSCKSCHNEETKKWRKENKEKLKDYFTKYNKTDRKRISNEKWRNKNSNFKDKKSEYEKLEIKRKRSREYGKSIQAKRKRKIRRQERWKNDIVYKISINIRRMIKSHIVKEKKSKTTFYTLGCSFNEFKNYIESKFEPWMTWNNYGIYNGEFNYGWDIDHIIPISSANTNDDVIKLNHYTNLQPLCGKINRDIKKDNIGYSSLSLSNLTM